MGLSKSAFRRFCTDDVETSLQIICERDALVNIENWEGLRWQPREPTLRPSTTANFVNILGLEVLAFKGILQ
ncbi:unnamed protein product, partial [Iphiclides podalirius]